MENLFFIKVRVGLLIPILTQVIWNSKRGTGCPSQSTILFFWLLYFPEYTAKHTILLRIFVLVSSAKICLNTSNKTKYVRRFEWLKTSAVVHPAGHRQSYKGTMRFCRKSWKLMSTNILHLVWQKDKTREKICKVLTQDNWIQIPTTPFGFWVGGRDLIRKKI